MGQQAALLVLISQAGYATHTARIQALSQQADIYLAGPGEEGSLDTLPFLPCDTTTPMENLLSTLDERGFTPDAILQIESEDFYPQGLIGLTLPAFYYATNAHQQIHWQMEYGKLFDAIFLPSPHLIDSMRRNGHPAVYSAADGVDLEQFNRSSQSRDLDLAFVGGASADEYPLRSVLHALLKDQGYRVQFTTKASAQERAQLYQRSRVVLHQGEQDVFSPTPLEAAACGAVPCTSHFSGLEGDLRPDQECIIFQDEHDLLHRLENLLGEGPRWHQLSEAALKRVQKSSWSSRTEQFLETMAPFLSQKRTHFDETERMKAHAYVYHVRGHGGRGIRMLNSLSDQFPEDVELHLLKALTFLNSNLYQEAARQLDTLLTQHQTLPEGFIEHIADTLLNTFELAGHTEGALHAAQVLQAPTSAQKRRLLRMVSRSQSPVPQEIIDKLRPSNQS
ncbi:glycosyltransferase family protein [Magnetococcus sp. PR-3]|uniref:glycosyltransferase family protein n=1 Tax=Magnetococcus sp. PR-3 TaxID=3120355 RepID=UPI002FCE5868